MLQAIEISKEYRKGQITTTVLSNINIEINAGEYLMVLGPSGSGKTTLLNILGFLDKPTKGSLHFKGQDICHLSDKERLALRRQEIGYVFKEANLIDELTVSENIELPLLYQKIKKRARTERVKILLGEMNLLHRKKNYPHELSALEQQKVAIARAMVIRPSVIFADEPTGDLNSADGSEILDVLGKINDNGTALILFTHAKSIIGRAQKLVQLFDGHLLLDNVIKQEWN
ncbi:ABC transporter ATP-binding protein [Saccharicrinis fermentans]|uniref:Lipoprotein-releasing system ATP-binding protein LolD n=1 Tax=Saccharicrinis fermentans DSM 9555 = JCM 21142 TaxID=869213 RepID=W7YJ53_9BACT|nr:ABC transporter ATP-binding protein [Saccharicrinis fermentans]GAF04516.1 lipoprotein-releasing system ATP-binding protein LolD [Saccharicrinis fermentans DSM 9555 = JCM 21142]